jgi:hypothetical protein
VWNAETVADARIPALYVEGSGFAVSTELRLVWRVNAGGEAAIGAGPD